MLVKLQMIFSKYVSFYSEKVLRKWFDKKKCFQLKLSETDFFFQIHFNPPVLNFYKTLFR